jgi:hypothetical protein
MLRKRDIDSVKVPEFFTKMLFHFVNQAVARLSFSVIMSIHTQVTNCKR